MVYSFRMPYFYREVSATVDGDSCPSGRSNMIHTALGRTGCGMKQA